MNRVFLYTVAAALLVLLGTALGSHASAQDVKSSDDLRLLCRHFKVDPAQADGDPFLTTDGTEQIGQWVNEYATTGWRVHSTDFEMGVNQNGFPVAFTQVCLAQPR